ncbi:MAG: adenylate cyclase [Mycobacterium sp.]|nr:adenylate cyclase [Mycobacterium sp.]
MDRIWQWAWDRYARRYSWAICAVTFPVLLPIYLFTSFVVVAFEKAGHYVEAAAVTFVTVPVLVYVMILPGLGQSRLAEQWAAGQEVDPARALDATYTWARATVARPVGATRWGPRCCWWLLV